MAAGRYNLSDFVNLKALINYNELEVDLDNPTMWQMILKYGSFLEQWF